MKVNGHHYQSVSFDSCSNSIKIIDQSLLPHQFLIIDLVCLDDTIRAITTMQIRGAPLIGATAAFALVFAMQQDSGDASLEQACQKLIGCRPTAVNLEWAVLRAKKHILSTGGESRARAALEVARQIAQEDVATNEAIGRYGLELIADVWRQKQKCVNILTHCNAGWLATVDWGTALAPIYMAQESSIEVHVWVDETRPRNQGMSLTAWELQQQGIACTVIADNAGGHIMQHGGVDMCIVGADRTTSQGDVCNKIGTYLKALAAYDNKVPFYVTLPRSTVDMMIADGIREIPIEIRSGSEVTHVRGTDQHGQILEVNMAPAGCQAKNYAFDVTPARLVTSLICEKGIYSATRDGLAKMMAKD